MPATYPWGSVAGGTRNAVDPGALYPQVVVEQHEVGALSGRDAPDVAQRKELRGIGAGHAHRGAHVEAEHAHGIAYRGGHVEVGAGEAAVLIDALAVRDRDGAAI